MEIIAQGAEAILTRDGAVIKKERVKKSYRLEELDNKIRKLRTRREIKILQKAAGHIPVPKLLDASEETCTILMEYIDGHKLAEVFNQLPTEKRKKVCKEIGKNIALLHKEDIIHGDLTTSNMILFEEEVYLIDFGLSFIDPKAEHKAVDLHLLKQALESKHNSHGEESYTEIIESYKSHYVDAKDVLDRLEKVEKRGRYKNKFM